MIQPEKYQLKNGLAVILIPTKAAHVVSINICVQVGSAYESNKEAGICHLIEHMLFKGTKKLGPGDMAKIIESSGGDVNAYTSFDETVYYCTLTSRFYKKGLEVLSEGVLHPSFDPTELEREKIVVLEELQRGKDSPARLLSEQLFTSSYTKHPYGRPIIGFKKTIKSFTQKKLLQFYDRWYSSSNMVLVLAGDFPTGEAKKLILKNFSSPQRAKVQKSIPKEPCQTQPRSFHISSKVQSTLLAMAFPIGNLNDPDIPALDILSHILGEGEGSHLDKKVKEDLGLVNSIYSYVYSPKFSGLFVIGATLKGKNVERACRQIIKEAYRLTQEKVTHDELDRAKISIRSDAIYEMETIEGIARKYGYYENILGNLNFSDQYLEGIDQVTVEHILRVAKKYLTPEKLTLGLLQPETAKPKYSRSQLLAYCRPVYPKLKRKEGKEIIKITLKNGVRLLLKENHNIPTLAIRTAHLAGIRFETRKTNGISSLFSHLWAKSTLHRSATELIRESELIAGSFDAYTGKNTCGLKGDFLSEKLHDGFKLFFDIFKNPRFDPIEIKREKQNICEAIRRSEDDVADLAVRRFLATLYKKHPYGFPPAGTRKNINKFSKRDLERYFKDVIHPRNTVISVVGDFDSSLVEDLFKKELEDLKQVPLKLPKMKTDLVNKKLKRIQIHKGKQQAHIVYGFNGLTIKSPDRFAMDVMNNILAGQGGRLFLELRDKHSLAYSVTSFTQEGIEPGFFAVYIATDPKKIDFAIEKIEEELRKIQSTPVTSLELHRSQQFIVGNYDIELQKNSSIANEYLYNEIYQMGEKDLREYPSKILKVSTKQVQKVANQYLNLECPIISIVK